MFSAPVSFPMAWTWSLDFAPVPNGLPLAGIQLSVLQGTPPSDAARAIRADESAARLLSPAEAYATEVRTESGQTVVRLDPLPFADRESVARLRSGIPAFYLMYTASTDSPVVNDCRVQLGEELARKVDTLQIGIWFPDGVDREPQEAWQSLAEAIDAEPLSPLGQLLEIIPPRRTLLVLTPTGDRRTTGTFTLQAGRDSRTARLRITDRGDLLQWTTIVTAADIAAGGVRLSVPSAEDDPSPRPDIIWALPDGTHARGEITLPPDASRVMFGDPAEWLAAQHVAGRPRFSFGNEVTLFPTGREYMEALFADLDLLGGEDAPGLHMAGEIFEAGAGLGAMPLDNLNAVVKRISDAPGRSRFLVPRILQPKEETAEVIIDLAYVMVIIAGVFGPIIVEAIDEDVLETHDLVLILIAALAGYPVANLVLPELEDAEPPYTELLEPGRKAVEDLNKADQNSISLYSRNPAGIEDNPHASTDGLTSLGLRVLRGVNWFRQRLAVLNSTAGARAYCGTFDLESTSRESRQFLLEVPVLGAQARVTGPAVNDLASTFAERWARDSSEPPAFETPALGPASAPGSMVVQVGRTYHRARATDGPPATDRNLPFAPQGDATIHDTLVAALTQARRFVYICDSFFVPPSGGALERALLDAAARVEAMVIVAPQSTKEPFASERRANFVRVLRERGAAMGRNVRVGTLRRGYEPTPTDPRLSAGQLYIGLDMDKTQSKFWLGPFRRMPGFPFWLSVNGEVMWVERRELDPPLPELPESDPSGSDPSESDPSESDPRGDLKDYFYVSARRGAVTNLFGRDDGAPAPSPSAHPRGTPADVIRFDAGEVRGGVVIIDDVFAAVGSASISRRGMFSDGQCTVFSMPEALAFAPSNPVADLRRQLWADLLNLPRALGEVLLRDPLSSVELFDRTSFFGNRFVPFESLPVGGNELLAAKGTSITEKPEKLLGGVLTAALAFTEAKTRDRVFDSISDPSSQLEPPATGG